MTTIEQIMKLADAHADASFTQGLEQITVDPRPEKAREKLKAAITELDSEKADLQKRLDAALAEIAGATELIKENAVVIAKGMAIVESQAAELDTLKKQEPAAWIGEFAIGPGNKGIYGWDKYPVGTKFYLAAGAQPIKQPLSSGREALIAELKSASNDSRIDYCFPSNEMRELTLKAADMLASDAQAMSTNGERAKLLADALRDIDALRAEIEVLKAQQVAVPQVPAKAITASIMREDGGEKPVFCVMAAYRSQTDAQTVLALLADAPHPPQSDAHKTCSWVEQDDKDMPGTYQTSCGELWSFTEGGSPSEHGAYFCHHCGWKIEVKP